MLSKKSAGRPMEEGGRAAVWLSLSSLPPVLGNRSDRLLFAINAGMYHPDYHPRSSPSAASSILNRTRHSHHSSVSTHLVEVFTKAGCEWQVCLGR